MFREEAEGTGCLSITEFHKAPGLGGNGKLGQMKKLLKYGDNNNSYSVGWV